MGEPAEVIFLTPSGGKARLCAARAKRTGKRCTQPARTGFRVCKVHGAGTRRREMAGTKKPVRLGALLHGVRAGDDAIEDLARTNPQYERSREDRRRAPERLRDFDEVLAHLWALADCAPVYVDERTVPPMLAVLERIRRALETDARLRRATESHVRVAVFQRFVVRLVDLALQYIPEERHEAFLAAFEAFEPAP